MRVLRPDQKPPVFISATACETVILSFEAALKRHGVVIAPNSPLERFALAAFQLAYGRLDSARSYPRDIRDLYREMIGITEFAAAVLRGLNSTQAAPLIDHLRLLANADPIQTTRSSGRDDAGDKLFELLIACAAIQCGTALSLEHPGRPTPHHPDVLSTMRGERWGFACKVPYSPSPQSVLANISSGIDQIERSSAAVGAVVLSGRSLLDHYSYFRLQNQEAFDAGEEPIFSAYKTPDDAKARVERDIQVWGKTLVDHAGMDALNEMYRGRKALPLILVWCQTVAGIPREQGGLQALGISFLSLQSISDPTPSQYGVFECLSRALQSALRL